MSSKTWVIKLGGAVLNTENAAKALFRLGPAPGAGGDPRRIRSRAYR